MHSGKNLSHSKIRIKFVGESIEMHQQKLIWQSKSNNLKQRRRLLYFLHKIYCIYRYIKRSQKSKWFFFFANVNGFEPLIVMLNMIFRCYKKCLKSFWAFFMIYYRCCFKKEVNTFFFRVGRNFPILCKIMFSDCIASLEFPKM